jgi:hypothetical protein
MPLEEPICSAAARRRLPPRLRARRTPLSVTQVLQWADEHHTRTGRWPNEQSGPVAASGGETWKAIALALHRGGRGLGARITLPQLLARDRGVRNKKGLPPLTEEAILAWAQSHRDRTGAWPNENSGPVEGAPGEKWHRVDLFLRRGGRGLPGGESLPRLLARRLGVLNRTTQLPLALEAILHWADCHRLRTGTWPNAGSGAVVDAPGEDWRRIDDSLRKGDRGLTAGSSLPRVLAERRGARNKAALPPLTLQRVLSWADAHHRRTGTWPCQESGPVAGVEGEHWGTIDSSLRTGRRGLPGGSSLVKLLGEQRGRKRLRASTPLTIQGILAWADAHCARNGKWPSSVSGDVLDAPGETWGAINACLWNGLRGLPGGDSLGRFLDRHRRGRTDRR